VGPALNLDVTRRTTHFPLTTPLPFAKFRLNY